MVVLTKIEIFGEGFGVLCPDKIMSLVCLCPAWHTCKAFKRRKIVGK